jgi:hypothetical protein
MIVCPVVVVKCVSHHEHVKSSHDLAPPTNAGPGRSSIELTVEGSQLDALLWVPSPLCIHPVMLAKQRHLVLFCFVFTFLCSLSHGADVNILHTTQNSLTLLNS